MNESSWSVCLRPLEMLNFLDGRIGAREFMRLSLRCCQRIRHLLTDSRSIAIVELTEQFLAGTTSADVVGAACKTWWDAYESDELADAAGGNTHQAIEMLQHEGSGAAIACSLACAEAVGYHASDVQCGPDCTPEQRTNVWRAAQATELAKQCDEIRLLFSHVWNH
jgi:hypothetical protein